MANTIKLKRGTSTPTTSNISSGEVAIDTSAQKLYINDSGTVKEIGGGGSVGGASGIDFNDDVKVRFGTGNDLEIFHDGTNNIIKAVNSNATYIDAQAAWLYLQSNAGIQLGDVGGNEVFLKATDNGAVELYHDNSKKLETISGGVLTHGNSYVNDSDRFIAGTGNDLQIYHNGSHSFIHNTTGHLKIGDSNVRLMNAACDEDMIHAKQNEGVELYYDNSKKFETASDGCRSIIAGTNSFRIGSTDASGVVLVLDGDSNGDGAGSDYCSIEHGTDGDLSIHADNPSGDSQFELYVGSGSTTAIIAEAAGEVQLFHNGTKKLATTSSGVDVTGSINATGQVKINDSFAYIAGTGNDLQIYHDGTHSYITNTTGDLRITDTTGMLLRSDSLDLRNGAGDENYITCAANGAVSLYYDNSKKFETNSTGTKTTGGHIMTNGGTVTGGDLGFADSSKAKFGDSDDLQIYHDGSNSYVAETGTGDLVLQGGTVWIQHGNGENALKATEDAGVELRYNNVKKFETGSYGFGTDENIRLNADNGSIQFGAGQDLKIYHDGNNSKIINQTGNLTINAAASEVGVDIKPNGAVELYYDNSKKLYTESDGIAIDGSISVESNGYIRVRTTDDNSSTAIQLGNDGAASFNSNLTVGSAWADDTNQSVKITDGQLLTKANTGTDAAIVVHQGGNQSDNRRFKVTVDGSTYLSSDSAKLNLGASNDLQLFHDGSHSYILSDNGELKNRAAIWKVVNEANSEIQIKATENAAVELYYDNAVRLKTRSNGNELRGSIQYVEGLLRPWSATGVDLGTDADRFQDLYLHNDLDLKDDGVIKLGNGSDLQLYHNGTDSYVDNSTGDMWYRTNGSMYLFNKWDNEYYIKCLPNAAVELRYDNSKKLETTSGGISVTGNVDCDGIRMLDSDEIRLGTGDDLKLWHNGTNSIIDNNTGWLQILSDNHALKDKDDGDNMIVARHDGEVELYHNGIKTFITAVNGAVIYGPEAGNAQLELYADEGDDNADKWRHLATVGGQYFLSNHASGGWEHNIGFTGNGNVELYYDNSKKFETRSAGTSTWGDAFIYGGEGVSASLYLKSDQGDDNGDGWRINSNQDDNDLTISNDITGSYVDKLTLQNDGDLFTTGDLYIQNDSKKLKLGSSNDMQLWHDGSHSHLQHENTGNLYVLCKSGQINFETASEVMAQMIPNGAVNLYYDNSKKLATDSVGTIFYDDIFVGDSYKVNLGASSDLQVYHDGSDSHIVNLTGDLRIECTGDDLNLKSNDDFSLKVQGGVESAIIATGNGAVELYYDNVKKLYTDTNGVRMDDSVWSYWGTDQDLYIGHNGYNAFIKNTTGDTNIQADALYLKNKDGDETYIKCANDNQVELYHNNVKRLETKSGGVQMHGDVWAWEIYNNTTSGGSNVRVQSSGLLQRDTSSRRYKNSITDAVHGLADLKKLRSVTFKGNNDGDTIFGGLIAEEVHDAGLTEFVDYNDDNQPEALCYGNMVSLCIKAIQELATEVETLKTKVTALEAA